MSEESLAEKVTAISEYNAAVLRWQWILSALVGVVAAAILGLYILTLPGTVTGTVTVIEPLRLAVQKAEPQRISEEKIEQAWTLNFDRPDDHQVLVTADFAGQHYVDTMCRYRYHTCKIILYGEIPNRSGAYVLRRELQIEYENVRVGPYFQTFSVPAKDGTAVYVEFTLDRATMLCSWGFFMFIGAAFAGGFLFSRGDAVIVRNLIAIWRGRLESYE